MFMKDTSFEHGQWHATILAAALTHRWQRETVDGHAGMAWEGMVLVHHDRCRRDPTTSPIESWCRVAAEEAREGTLHQAQHDHGIDWVDTWDFAGLPGYHLCMSWDGLGVCDRCEERNHCHC